MSAPHKWLYREKRVSETCGSTLREKWDVVDVFPPAVSDYPCFSHAGVTSGGKDLYSYCWDSGEGLGLSPVRFSTLKAA